mgnify:CR=1 FL=1|tara:strand:+ start:51 stop:203 length:153 start_codon:yes stop_codon:yes gene_type:complete
MRRYRVLRGGPYFNVTWDLRSTYRVRGVPECRRGGIGFRVVVKRRKKKPA